MRVTQNESSSTDQKHLSTQAQLQSCRLWVEVGGGQTLRPDSDVEITAWTRKAQTPPTRIQKHLHLLSELIQGTLSGSCAVV